MALVCCLNRAGWVVFTFFSNRAVSVAMFDETWREGLEVRDTDCLPQRAA